MILTSGMGGKENSESLSVRSVAEPLDDIVTLILACLCCLHAMGRGPSIPSDSFETRGTVPLMIDDDEGHC